MLDVFFALRFFSEHGGWEKFWSGPIWRFAACVLVVAPVQTYSLARIGVYQGLAQTTSLRATFMTAWNAGLLPWITWIAVMLGLETSPALFASSRSASRTTLPSAPGRACTCWSASLPGLGELAAALEVPLPGGASAWNPVVETLAASLALDDCAYSELILGVVIDCACRLKPGLQTYGVPALAGFDAQILMTPRIDTRSAIPHGFGLDCGSPLAVGRLETHS